MYYTNTYIYALYIYIYIIYIYYIYHIYIYIIHTYICIYYTYYRWVGHDILLNHTNRILQSKQKHELLRTRHSRLGPLGWSSQKPRSGWWLTFPSGKKIVSWVINHSLLTMVYYGLILWFNTMEYILFPINWKNMFQTTNQRLYTPNRTFESSFLKYGNSLSIRFENEV